MGRAGWFDETMRFFDHYVRDVPLADAADRQGPAAGGPDLRRHVALRDVVAAGRLDRDQGRADPGRLQRRRPEQRHRVGRGQRPVDDLAAAGVRRLVRRRRQGDARAGLDRPADRRRGRRRLRHRRQAHGDAAVAPGVAGARRRQAVAGPVRQRLEGPGRPPPRRAGDRHQRRVVDRVRSLRADADLRVRRAAVPQVQASRHDPGRQVGAAGGVARGGAVRAARGRRHQVDGRDVPAAGGPDGRARGRAARAGVVEPDDRGRLRVAGRHLARSPASG